MELIKHIFPELFLSISIMVLLMTGVFLKKSFKTVFNLTILVLIFTFLLVLIQPKETIKIFNGSFLVDDFSIFMKVLTLTSTFFILHISKDYIKTIGIDQFEYLILVFLPP